MIRMLSKHGNSMALVIDRGVMDLLNIEKDTPLDVTTDGSVLIIAPVREARRRRQFLAAMNEGNARYGRMLKRLA